MKNIKYVDLNNNIYQIAPSLLQYEPMEARYSSSGDYDGGEPISAVLSTEEFAEIVDKVKIILEKKELHSKKRGRLTTLFFITIGRKTTKYIINRSYEQGNLEKVLKLIRRKVKS